MPDRPRRQQARSNNDRVGGGHVAFGCNLRKRGRGWGWVRYPLIGPQPTRAIFVCAENGNCHCHRRWDRLFEGTQNAHCLIKDSPFWLPHLETGYLSFSVSLCRGVGRHLRLPLFLPLQLFREERGGDRTETRRCSSIIKMSAAENS